MYIERHALTIPAPYDISLVWVIDGYEHIGWLDETKTRVIGEGFNVPITNNTYWLEKIIDNESVPFHRIGNKSNSTGL